jgi:hypothetical protein
MNKTKVMVWQLFGERCGVEAIGVMSAKVALTMKN